MFYRFAFFFCGYRLEFSVFHVMLETRATVPNRRFERKKVTYFYLFDLSII